MSSLNALSATRTAAIWQAYVIAAAIKGLEELLDYRRGRGAALPAEKKIPHQHRYDTKLNI